jgi:4-carboxymuconolactone decarboxylase
MTKIKRAAVASVLAVQLASAQAATQTPSTQSLNARDVHGLEAHVVRLTQPRIAPLPLSAANAKTAAMLDSVRQDGKVYNLFSTLAQHPQLMEKWLPFASQVLLASSLPARDREFIVLRIGWLSQTEYEWGHHVVIGKQVGLTDADITRITQGPEAAGLAPFDATLLRAVDELSKDSFVTDATWNLLAEKYNTQQLMDLLFLAGNYKLVSMVLNSMGVQLEEGFEGFPKND